MAGLFLLVLAAYGPALLNGYTMDDRPAIERNRLVAERGRLAEILTTNYWWGFGGQAGFLYRPLTVLSHAGVWRLLGPSPVGPHAVNVLLHFLVCVVLAACLRRLPGGGPLAFPAAAIFAVHPIHTEAVASAVGRGELLAAVLSLLVLWFHLGRGRDPTRLGPTPGQIAAAAGVAALGMLSKEVALPAVALPLLADVARPDARARIRRGVRAAYPAMLLAAAGVLALRWRVIGGIGAPSGVPASDNPLVELGGMERLAATLGVCARHALVLLFPVRLSADYSLGSFPLATAPLDPWVLAALGAAIGLGALAAASWRRNPAAFVFLVGSCLFFLPASNLVIPIRLLMAERTLYLPSAGACVLIAWWGRAVPRSAGPALLVCLSSVLLARTIHRNLDWRADLALFSAAARVHPGSFRVQEALGEIALAAGDAGGALDHFRRAVDANPRDPVAFLGRARSLAALGRSEGAIEVLMEADRLHPGFPPVLHELGWCLLRVGRIDEALAHFDRVLEKEPRSRQARAGRIQALMRLERWDLALGALADEIPPMASPAEIERSRGECLYALDRTEEAEGSFRSALAIDPMDGRTWADLGRALGRFGRADEASAAFGRALALDARAPGALPGFVFPPRAEDPWLPPQES